MGYHPRIECKKRASFITTRSRNSRLWFVNNPKLEHAILGFAAKYTKRYKAKLYALAIEGNHNQLPGHFPEGNRSDFMRDFNSSVARAVDRYTPEYTGGRFWGRRYSQEFLPEAEDIKEYFFYTVLQPVQDGLVAKISEYPGYNCFDDAIWCRKKRYKVVNWAKYNAAKRRDPNAAIKDYTETVILQFERLPGYEGLTQKEYAKQMQDELEERRMIIVNDRLSRGLGFMGRDKLLQVKPGAYPRNTKKSTINSHRPRVLSKNRERRESCKEWYFSIYFAFKDASQKYRSGDLFVEFPEGTYRPYLKYPLSESTPAP